MANFTLNGTAIKNPSGFDIEYYTISQATRVESGDMVMDFVANKRKFKFKYEAINGLDMNNIIFLLWSNLATTRNCFSTLVYMEDGLPNTATVYSGSIAKSLYRASNAANWIWNGVTFDLIEK